MKKRSLCKINFSRIFFRAKYSKYISILLLVFYIGLEACTTRQAKDTTSSDQESVTVNIQIPSGGTDGVLSVNRGGEQLDWRGDTLAFLSWWDSDGNEQSESVAEVNGWAMLIHCIRRTGNTDLFTVNLKTYGIHLLR